MNLIPRSFYLDDIFDDFMKPAYNDMKCDIYEKGDNYHIELDIPGFQKEDISIDVDDQTLTVIAEKSSEMSDEEDKNYIRRERRYGKYQRSFYLGDVNYENIKAEFKHGMLKIIIPKQEKIETKKKIEIE